MQTPGLPVSQPASANHAAAHSAYEKSSHAAGEKFGDVMDRALTSREGDKRAHQQVPARQHHSHFADDPTSKSEETPDKANTNKKHVSAGHKSENSELPAPSTEITTSPVPVLSPTVNQSAFHADESLKGTSTPIVPTSVKRAHFTRASITHAPAVPTHVTPAPVASVHIASARSESTPLAPASVVTASITPAPIVATSTAPVRIAPIPVASTPVTSAASTPVSTTPLSIAPTPVSTDATDTKVSDAKPTEAEPTKNPAPETATTPQDSKMSETTDSTDHAQKTPPTAVTEELTAAVEAIDSNPDETKTAVQGDPVPQLGQIAPAKAGHEPTAASPPAPHGTSAAKQDMTMKKAEKTQKVAGPAEQDLPGSTATGSEELPQGQKLSAKTAVHGEKPESTAIELPTRISTSVESPAPTVTAAAPAPASSIDSRVLERTHDIVALHAMRLTDTGADSLRVVVKPGGGVQLSLELRQSARGIEVSAELHKGDYQHLNQHWADLQQRLEARGVRVSSLTTAENYTGGQHFNQSKQQSSNQDPLHAGAFAEFALAGSMTEAPGARAARASAYRGWETWA